MCIIYWLAEQLLVFQELCSVQLLDYIVKVSLLMQTQLATNCPCRTGFRVCSCRLHQLVNTSHTIVLMENSQGHTAFEILGFHISVNEESSLLRYKVISSDKRSPILLRSLMPSTSGSKQSKKSQMH